MLISDVQQIESLLGMYYQFYVCVCVYKWTTLLYNRN